MTTEFLVKNTTIGELEQNTVIEKAWLKSPILFVEYYIRRKLARRFVDKFVDDMLKYPELKAVFVSGLNLSISNDGCFLFLPFDNDIPSEVKEQSEPSQLMTLAESYMTEKLQMIIRNPDYMSTFAMTNIYSTMGFIPSANSPFILFETKHLTHMMAIENNKFQIYLGTAVYSIIAITLLILTFKYFF